jgi:hypothetical protein
MTLAGARNADTLTEPVIIRLKEYQRRTEYTVQLIVMIDDSGSSSGLAMASRRQLPEKISIIKA